MNNIVYAYFVLDIVHKGHLIMLKNAKSIAGENGKLIVGILTDEAVSEKKPKTILNFTERIALAESIKYIDAIVAQETYSPLPNVLSIKPDILIESPAHGDTAIKESEKVMKRIGGKLIVMPYYPAQSSSNIKEEVSNE